LAAFCALAMPIDLQCVNGQRLRGGLIVAHEIFVPISWVSPPILCRS
jgi:hypothetical protein